MSKNLQDNWAVGMVHELCVCCGKPTNHQIIIPEKLNQKTKQEIEQAHGKAIGFADEPCKECQQYVDDGFVLLIGIDPDKSEKDGESIKPEDAYRTGSQVWLKREVANSIFNTEITHSCVFIDDEIFDHIHVEDDKTLRQQIEEERSKEQENSVE